MSEDIISLQEVNEWLTYLRINIAPSTIRNYVKRGLVSPGERKSLGKQKGVTTVYPLKAVAEIYAAYHLLNGKIKTDPYFINVIRNAYINQVPGEVLSFEGYTVLKLYEYYFEYAIRQIKREE